MGAVVAHLGSWQSTNSYVRSFAYATGPALGFSLDLFDPGWRTAVIQTRDFAGLLYGALHPSASDTSHETALARVRRYDSDQVANDEDTREAARQEMLRSLNLRLVDGPVLIARQAGLRRSFDPRNLVPLGDVGTVYPTGTLSAAWGTIDIDSVGALVSPDNSELRVAAPRDVAARPIRGPGYTLTLAPGWTIKRGERPGDLVLVRDR